MRLSLLALGLALALTACDPDTTGAAEGGVSLDEAPQVEDAPGDTGLPDTLRGGGVQTPPILPQTEDAPGDTGLPDTLR